MKKNEQKRSQVSSPSPKRRKSAQKSRNQPTASKSPVQKSQESPAPVVVEPTKGGFALASDDDDDVPNTKVQQKNEEAADEYSEENYSDN